MKRYKWIIILLNLCFILIYYNYSINQKEQLLKNGELILLELAPEDPRSLMQGDYMNLTYTLAEDFYGTKKPKRGYCIVKTDTNHIAISISFQEQLSELKPKEYPIKYTSLSGYNLKIGAESYFFQEGNVKKYEKVKYGGLKVDKSGNSLLVGLFDNQLNLIE